MVITENELAKSVKSTNEGDRKIERWQKGEQKDVSRKLRVRKTKISDEYHSVVLIVLLSLVQFHKKGFWSFEHVFRIM